MGEHLFAGKLYSGAGVTSKEGRTSPQLKLSACLQVRHGYILLGQRRKRLVFVNSSVQQREEFFSSLYLRDPAQNAHPCNGTRRRCSPCTQAQPASIPNSNSSSYSACVPTAMQSCTCCPRQQRPLTQAGFLCTASAPLPLHRFCIDLHIPSCYTSTCKV